MAHIWKTDTTKHLQGCGATKKFHSRLMGIQSATVPLEDVLAVTYKVKHPPGIGSSSGAPWHLFTQWS